ncbi:MAG: hypothetical protein K8W52_33135 [Deltaproteobacteria bacterium]|nr:hypothetical protein [Deltaproteobacteria bacterium]
MACARLGSIALVAVAILGRPARAGVASWRLSEVLPAGANADPAIRFIELHTAASACWFATTRLAVYDGAGQSIGTVAPFVSTTCFPADTYLLLATPEAQAAYSVTADDAVVPSLPRTAGQLCLVSSSTPYDCVRWGAISVPVHDLLGPDDDTAVVAPPGGTSLIRVAEVHVVTTDWAFAAPTPRAPNDGTPWIPPDAGAPDAPLPDGAPGDAGLDGRLGDTIDARPPSDARRLPDATNNRYLDLDPGGGACACRTASPSSGAPILVALVALARRRRRRP